MERKSSLQNTDDKLIDSTNMGCRCYGKKNMWFTKLSNNLKEPWIKGPIKIVLSLKSRQKRLWRKLYNFAPSTNTILIHLEIALRIISRPLLDQNCLKTELILSTTLVRPTLRIYILRISCFLYSVWCHCNRTNQTKISRWEMGGDWHLPLYR